jgi:hypothetical protein
MSGSRGDRLRLVWAEEKLKSVRKHDRDSSIFFILSRSRVTEKYRFRNDMATGHDIFLSLLRAAVAAPF